MPIYEYKCAQCGRVQEILQSLSAPPPTECECGANGGLDKIFSVFSVGATQSSCATGVDCGAAGGDGGGAFTCSGGGCGGGLPG